MAFQGDSIFWVEVEKIVPNPFQPRREFDESKLKELSESVRMYGILQPLTVTRKEIQSDNGAFRTEYELIAGERRLRASILAGLAQVPVIIREGEQSEQEKLELAIIENLQREDLNAVDRAFAFRQLADTFELSHAAVAKKVGRSREYVSNTLRLLLLPEYMLSSLRLGDITEGHGRTLLMLNDRAEEQDTVFREILLKKLSVREVERIARKIASDKVRSKKWKDSDPELIEIEKQFTETLGTRVQISKTDYGGKLTIDYFSQEDLDKLLALVNQEPAPEKNPNSSYGMIAAVEEVPQDKDNEQSDAVEKLATHTPLEPVQEEQPTVSEPEPTPPVSEPESEPEPVPIVPTPEVKLIDIENNSSVIKDSSDREETVSAPAAMDSFPEKMQGGQDAQDVQETPQQEKKTEVAPEYVPQTLAEGEVTVDPDISSILGHIDDELEINPPSNIAYTSTKTPLIQPPEPTQDTAAAMPADDTFIAPETVKEKEEDDSDLYSIGNFGV